MKHCNHQATAALKASRSFSVKALKVTDYARGVSQDPNKRNTIKHKIIIMITIIIINPEANDSAFRLIIDQALIKSFHTLISVPLD